MRNVTVIFIISLAGFHSFAQNKTLGVGTSTLNPNAALQVDAPSGNQGVLLPRLTTAQRTAMVLTSADKGLIVFDSDLNLTHTWNGTFWMNGTTSVASQKLIFPYKDSLAVNPATGDALFHLVNTSNQPYADVIKGVNRGTGGAAGSFIIKNAANTGTALYSETNGTGYAGLFMVNNSSSGKTALVGSTNSNLGGTLAPVGVYGESTGTGSLGGAFWNTNAANNWPALYAKTLGTSSSIRSETSTGFASIYALQSSSSPDKHAMLSVHDGTGNGLAGLFQNTNAANQYPAIQAETAGVGHGVKVLQNATSLGGGLIVQIQNTTSTGLGITVDQQGLATAGQFIISNAASSSPSLFASTNGTDVAIRGEATGSGSAGNFRVTNPASNNTALYAEQQGTGPAVVGAKWLTANGHSGYFINGNNGNTESTLRSESSSNSASAFESIMSGTSSAGYFEVNNGANPNAGIYSTTNGTGAAVQGQTDTGFAAVFGKKTGTGGNAIQGEHSGTSGNAGEFYISNAANNGRALNASTVGAGAAIFGSTSTGYTAVAGQHNGTTNGFGGLFEVTNAANTYQAIKATTAGMGGAARFENTNASGSNPNVESLTNSPGGALRATSTGTGYGGWLEINNASSGASALQATTNGTGQAGNFQISNASSTNYSVVGQTNGALLSAGVYGNNTGNGFGVFGKANGSAIGSAAVYGEQTGTGDAAGAFRINNVANVSNAVYGETNGAASAINATQLGTGTGLTAQINNSSNTANAIRAITNGTGNGLFVNHTGVGLSSTTDNNLATFQSAGANVARIDKTGKGWFNGGTATAGADLAELFDVEGSKSEYEPGDVLVISESTDRTIEKSNAPYSTKVAGVYATKPGVTLTEKDMNESIDDLVPMGVIGVIPTKVCMENGPIKRGDLLVTSSTKGHAMKAVSAKGDGMFPAGVIIGKALENFEQGERGLIKVLVNVK